MSETQTRPPEPSRWPAPSNAPVPPYAQAWGRPYAQAPAPGTSGYAYGPNPYGPDQGGPGQYGPSQYGVPPTTPPSGPSAPAARRGPGWPGLVAAMALTGLLSGGLGAVGATALDDDPTVASAPTTSRQVDPPVRSDGDTAAIDWTAVADAVGPSVVTIQLQGQQGAGQGSGVLIDADGSILTNNHVVASAADGADVRVVLADGRVYSDVEVVGLDPSTDLAVIRIGEPPADLQPATLGDSAAVAPGQPVMALGNPLGLSDTVTTGIVSAVDRPVTTQGQSSGDRPGAGAEPVVTNAIQTDAPINPGNSGGALVDASGSVIGINSSIASTGAQAGSIGLGFAIPINEAKRIADELITEGVASHAVLGVLLGDGVAETSDGTRQAALVGEVVAGSPAESAGLRAEDAVVGVDGEAVSGAESLTAQIRERAPGATVVLSIVRGGETLDVDITLGTRQAD